MSNLLVDNGYYGLSAQDIELLSGVQRKLVNDNDVEIPEFGSTDKLLRQRFSDSVKLALKKNVPLADLEKTALRLADALCGIGILEQFLRDDDIEEIYVRNGEVAIEKKGKLHRHVVSAPNSYWELLVKRVADERGKALTTRHRAVLVDLPSGARFTGLLPPLTDFPAINIRRYGAKNLTLSDLRKLGAFEKHDPRVVGSLTDIIDDDLRASVAALPENSVERLLAWVVASQAGNILFAGEFSSGKTTAFNAISPYFPPDSPLALLETFRELQPADNLFTMRAIAPSENLPGEEEVATMDWVLNVVYTRTNPGAVFLSEIVSPGEASQFLTAANIGRRAYSTIHGGTVMAALRRLEKFALRDQAEIGNDAVREMIAGGVDLIVLMARRSHGGGAYRFVAEIALLRGLLPDGGYDLKTLYSGWTTGIGVAENAIEKAWGDL